MKTGCYISIIILLVFSTLFANAQIDSIKINFKESESFQIERGQYFIDNSDYIYVVNDDEIFKYSTNGELLFRYSNLALGDISTIDVSNPMKVLVFYKLNSQLVILDNTLTQRGETIQLEDRNLYQATAIGFNYLDNGIWVFDQSLFQLVRLNENFEVTYESGNLAEILHMKNLNVNRITIRHQNMYLQTEENGLLVFDIYGTFFKKIPISQPNDFQVDEKFIYYLKNNQYFAYSLMDFEEYEIELPVKSVDFVWNAKNNICVISNGNVTKFAIVEK